LAGNMDAKRERSANRQTLLKALAVLLICVFSLFFEGRQSLFAVEDANWETVLKKYQESYGLALGNLTTYKHKLKQQTKDFRKGLVRLEKKRGQMFLWFGAGYDPEDLKYTLKGTAGLRQEAARLIKPFNDLGQMLDLFGDKVDEVEMEILGQLTYAPRVEYGEALKENLHRISDLKTRLARVQGPIENADRLYKDFLDRLSEMEKTALSKIPKYESVFYFEVAPSLFSSDAWGRVGEDVDDCLTLFNILKESLADSRETRRIWATLVESVLIGVGLILFGWLAIRKAAPRFSGCPDLSGLFPATVLLSISGSVLWAARDITFMLYPLLSSIGEILFAAGLVSLACFLREMTGGSGPFPAGRRPLWTLWTLTTTGLALRVLDSPYPFEVIVWSSVLILAAVRFQRESRKTEKAADLVFLRSGVVLCAVLAFLAVYGFINISILIVFILFYAVVTFRVSRDAVRLLRALEDRFCKDGLSPIVAGFIQGFCFPGVILGFLVLNLWLFASRIGGDEVFLTIFSFDLAWRDLQINLKKLFLVVTGFYLTRSAILISDLLLLKFRSRRPDMDLAVMDSFLKGTNYIWWFFFALCTLSLLGFSLTSITVIAGGLSVGIGFGLQHIVNNFFSGLILLFGRAIQSGDTIQIGNILGDVRRVTIRSTVVQTRENATLFIPNSDLITNQIVNWSHRDREVVREINVGVAYGSDTGKVRDLLFHAAAGHPNVRKDPAPQVLFYGFGASSLDFKVKFRIDNIDDDQPVMSDVCFEIDRLFKENGIEIAFPQTDLHLRTASGLERFWKRSTSGEGEGS